MAPSPRPTQRVVVPAAVTRPVAQRPAPLQIL
jgi:hypothetical protein